LLGHDGFSRNAKATVEWYPVLPKVAKGWAATQKREFFG
jgi:hypothetical protein